MKKEYETVWEIFNECANNQMRDVFFDEIETDDPEAYIRQKFPDKNLKYEKTVEADGSLVFDIETSGIRRAIGHMESIKRMVEEGRDCTEVLIQLSAVKAAINNTGKIILEDHIEHCIVDAVEHGDIKAIQELNKAIDRFVK